MAAILQQTPSGFVQVHNTMCSRHPVTLPDIIQVEIHQTIMDYIPYIIPENTNDFSCETANNRRSHQDVHDDVIDIAQNTTFLQTTDKRSSSPVNATASNSPVFELPFSPITVTPEYNEDIISDIKKTFDSKEELKTRYLDRYCKICDKTFQYPYILKRHQLSKHKSLNRNAIINKPSQPTEELKCSICGETFKNKSRRYQHVRLHHAKQKCPFCSNSYIELVSLKKHIRQRHLLKMSHPSQQNVCNQEMR